MSSFKLRGINNLNKKITKLEKELKGLRKPNKKIATQAGRLTIREMKKLIRKGTSPISKKRNFPAYKNPSRYPGKRKRHRPVNLRLTGEFLKSLDVDVKKTKLGYVSKVGFTDSESIKKEEGHRKGANGQRKRPIIPSTKEKFAKPIITELGNFYQRAVSQALEKLAKKKL